MTLSQRENSLGKLEDVKDKLFHLNPIGFVWCDELTSCVHVRNLLLSHVVLQHGLVLPEETNGKKNNKRCMFQV